MDKSERIKELIDILNEASKVYYSGTDEIMSNFEYDRLYDELVELENETGIHMSGSPTSKVGYETLSELPKENHEKPMLSLDKTKSVDTLAEFAGVHKCLLSWKLDGLTVVLTYNNGELVKAVTRGNGYVGEVITPNAKVFKNIPLTIPYKGELILRGEAIITYSDFNRINDSIIDDAEKYKNPRNLCSGSVRQLNNEITAKRNVKLIAFALIKAEGINFHNSVEEQFEFLEKQGFEVVERKIVDGTTVHSAVQYFSDKIKENDFPSDGLVMIYDDINYGLSLGTTAKFPRNAIAFKWKDETVLTTLREIEWSASRTGLINPVAIFDPVELEGTTVTRASVHNVSIVKELKLGIGDKITVYKANMIIPQIAENITSSGTAVIPDKCPVCGENTQIIESAGASFLYCVNKDCSAKHIKRFEHFCERNALNIEGISMQTLDKFIECGYIKEFEDIYHLDRYEERIVSMDGFGKKSYDNMIESINNSRTAMLANVIYGLGIDGIGLAGARLICRYFEDDVYKVINATKDELLLIDGIGEVLADSYVKYFSDEKNRKEFELLLKELHLVKEERNTNSPVSGKTFVITGSLNHYANRDELKAVIEQNGGKTTGSVSAKTDYLINNDLTSNSSKNKKAKELGIPVISEDDFIKFLE
ncbi:NAD-dependent DNA ligase LigA [Eshraghiella crossota]|uniref:NAD-dependent DNA ligase LigA n=1 Tax=Eshraghiella crossota TaxID=45851 RepID=UPI003AB89C60